METKKELNAESIHLQQREIDNLNSKWNKALEATGVEDYMTYKPFTDQYWNEKYRICICNLETYGYEDCGKYNVDLNLFTEWFDKKKNKTIKSASVFVNGLLCALNGNTLSHQELHQSYKQKDRLLEAINRITYMNFRKTTNKTSNQNQAAIRKEVSDFLEFYKQFFKLLNPDIIILGGEIGSHVFNDIFPDSGLEFNGYTKINQTHVFSIYHFRLLDYTYFCSKIDEIAKTVIKN